MAIFLFKQRQKHEAVFVAPEDLAGKARKFEGQVEKKVMDMSPDCEQWVLWGCLPSRGHKIARVSCLCWTSVTPQVSEMDCGCH